MTDTFWPPPGSGPSSDAKASEELPKNDSRNKMRNTRDTTAPGSTALFGQSNAEDPPTERSLRKRKRDLRNEPAVPPTETDLDQPGQPGVNDYHQPPPSALTGEPNKRAKVENLAIHTVMHPGKHRVPSNRAQLPGEIWQHIFKFVPPYMLGRLMRVGRSFELLLRPAQTELPDDHATLGVLKNVHPNSIWATSRKIFYPGMPRPLSSMTELDMWKLVAGTACQFCSKRASSSFLLDSTTPWDSGPGEDGVRVIWPFRVRACGECLIAHCDKEMDLLFSSAVPTLVIPAIPFAFFTSSMHYVSSSTLRSSQPPPGLTLTKYFLKSQIGEMKSKFGEVRSLGSATAEEWIKGLEGNGKEKMADAARWEQWEISGGLRSPKPAGHYNPEHPSLTGLTADHDMAHSDNSASLANGRSANPARSPKTEHTRDTKKFPSPDYENGLHHIPMHLSSRERSLRDVNEAKATRRTEIESRCLKLDPPLTTAVLSHMDSFTAAIQIPHPFTDRDWEILKPRLLAQREAAERREEERMKQETLLQAKAEERRAHEAQLREAKEILDREWEEAQKPIRERMATYADEIIREGWRGGDGVVKEKCPKFAADVLIYVRDKFYAHVAQENAIAQATGVPLEPEQPGAPPKRKLLLENMKWIFDTKIKPLTEKFQKELFLCNGCENNTKYYGFEGVIQHYAAKHTSVLSLGSVVVHWRSEWPEQSPFHPNPEAARALMYAMPRANHGHMYRPMYGHGPDLPPQVSPGPYSRTPYGTPYAFGSGPFRPPSPSGAPFYQPQQQPYGYNAPQPGFAPPNQPPPPPPPMYGSPYPGPGYQPPPYPPPYGGAPVPSSYSGAYPSRGPAQGQGYGPYQTELDEFAKNARNLWNGTSGIKDLPHNVRAHVLIHHVTTRFLDRFHHDPPLSLFADALNRHQQMRPIKNLAGLMCKTCGSHRRGRAQDHARGDHRKVYTLPALISHFTTMHGEHYDWKREMLALPEDATVESLVNAPGMDDGKLNLLAAAFPWVFPSGSTDTPPDGVERRPSDRRHGAGRNTKSEESKANAESGLEVAVDNFPRFAESPARGERPLERPRPEEYDPHRPAFLEPVKGEHGAVDRSLASRHPPVGSDHAAQAALHSRHGRISASGHSDGGVSQGQHPSKERSVTLEASGLGTRHSKVPSSSEKLPAGLTQEARKNEEAGGSLRHVSEDGEVAEPHQPGTTQNAEPAAEEMNAAERFLNDFDPVQERAEYTEHPREGDPVLNHKRSWHDAADPDDRRYRKDLDYGAPPDTSRVGTPTARGPPGHVWRGGTKSPGARPYHDYGARPEAFESGPPRHVDDLTPDPTDPRQSKRYADAGHPGRRPHSRFERYEAARQASIRNRSRSPGVHEPLPMEATYYRERSPPRVRARQRTAYPGHEADPYAERVPVERVYSRVAPPTAQYHYVDDPRYTDPAYEAAVDYAPMKVSSRDPQAAYYIERPVHREVPVEYEMEYQRQPVYDTATYPAGAPARDAPGMPGAMPRRSRYR